MGRPNITTDWNARISPWDNVMDIIQTWFWDDSPVWQDIKIWWDSWEVWTAWEARTPVTTNWN